MAAPSTTAGTVAVTGRIELWWRPALQDEQQVEKLKVWIDRNSGIVREGGVP
jgi:hypothetical protein